MNHKDSLIQHLNALIEAYDQVVRVLDEKIEAVVQNDLERIENLAEEQIANNNTLEQLEVDLKKCLSKITEGKNYPDPGPTLGVVLQNEFDNDKSIKKLRTSLLARIADSQRLQYQLNSLLSFAREHIEHTLKNIYALNNHKTTTSYDHRGRRKPQEGSIFSRYA